MMGDNEAHSAAPPPMVGVPGVYASLPMVGGYLCIMVGILHPEVCRWVPLCAYSPLGMSERGEPLLPEPFPR